MIYRKLFDWVDGDDACETTEVTIYSAHDPSHDGEQDFIIRRVKSLIETGVAIQSIKLKIWMNTHGYDHKEYDMLLSPPGDNLDVDAIDNTIKSLYSAGESIETMIIKVSIKELHWA